MGKYKGDIQSFKMDMRAQMGISGNQSALRGDASVKKKDNNSNKGSTLKKNVKEKKKSLDVISNTNVPPLSDESPPRNGGDNYPQNDSEAKKQTIGGGQGRYI